MAIKSGQLREKTDYQAYILEMLRDGNGYLVRSATAYDPGYGMDTELLFSFFEQTQPEALEKLNKLYGDKTRQTILNYINNEINKKNRCLLDVLKHGVEYRAVSDRQDYFPAEGSQKESRHRQEREKRNADLPAVPSAERRAQGSR